MTPFPALRSAALQLWLLAAAWAVCAPAHAAAAPANPPVQSLSRALFVLSDSATPPAPETAAPVTLPDDWEVTRPTVTGSGWYLIEWTPPSPRARTCAVYLTGIVMPAEVYVNGHLIGTTGALQGPRPRSWQQSQLFTIPESLVRAGVNHIALRVHESTRGAAGLGPLLVGPEPQLRQRAMRDMFLHTVGPAVVSATIVAMGMFIVVLWLRRRNPTYGLFGFAAILWGVHTGLSLTTSPFLPQPHWSVWWTALYMLFVGLLCLFCLRFAEVDWHPLRRFIAGFVVATPIALYVAAGLDQLGIGTAIVRLTGIVIVLASLTAVARYALRKRDTESLLLLAAGAISTVFAVHDWLVIEGGTQIRPLMLVPYAGLAFLMLVGWILTDRFVRALNEFEALNTGLEQRVAEKSEALNEQLAQTRVARDAAEAADRAKTRFFAAASHDLRQPLHALGLFASRLSDRTRDPEDTALIKRITTAVTSLETLFSALLDISRLEAGVVSAQPRPMALNPLLDRLAEEFAPEAVEHQLKLAVLPTSRIVYSDPVLLERILRNLIANALRYTREGGIVVGARKRGRWVAIEVWDSGSGIAPENIERMFEEFYQVGNPERDRAKGMGLGLAIVRRLSRLLGHEVEVASRPGRGSVFRVLLAEAPAGSIPEVPASLLHSSDPLAGRRVLVVDDDEAVREGTRQTLVAWGCVPLVAADAGEALAACRGQPRPDAMLVDYRLPGGSDGIDAIARLRTAIGHPVPAIVISGESSSEQLARIKAAGFVLLSKPVAPAKMRAALAHVLQP